MKNMFNRFIIAVVIFTILNFSTPALLNNEIDNYSKTDLSVSKIYEKLDRDIVWDVNLSFTEPGGEFEYAVFGEAPDANDGPPADGYDEPKPPSPPAPYIRAWFDDNLEAPYNRMIKDYRKYPDTYKVWNLTVQWVEDDENPTTVNISWNISEFDDCEYNYVTLYEGQYGGTLVEVADMLIDSNYSYFAEETTKYDFTIICELLNDPPVAVDDDYSVDEGGTLSISAPGVLGNDYDNESDPLTAVLDSGPNNASSFTLNSDGSFDYVHDGSETTSDSFTYHANDGGANSNIATVTITISPLNDPPVAVDDSFSVDEGGTLGVSAPGVLDNDYDNESDPLTAVLDSGPSHASSFTLNSDGSFEYVHDGSETTSDSFTYHANDGSNDSNIATVTITINPVNDPPVASFTFEPSDPSTSDIIYFNSTSTDIDGTIVNWTWDFDDGNFGYGEFATHQYDDDGSYDVILTVEDDEGATDTDTQTVSVSNEPPIAEDDTASTPEDTPVIIDVVENDYDTDGEIDPTTVDIVDDANHGETSVNPTTGKVTYTPDPDYYGSDSFTYTVDDDDGATSNEATVDITITSDNDPPVAVDDTANTPQDTPVLIDVLANDYDVDSDIDETTVDIQNDVSHGSTSVDPNNGVVTYTPDSNYYGEDSFTYTVDDEEGATSNIATVNITVGMNHEPNKPDKPSGQTRGKWGVEYDYKTSTIDPDGDQVWYNFSWGDGTHSGWVGPFASGAIATVSHKWTKDGWSGNFQIKVQAKDDHDAISEWSDPLPITMPKSYNSDNSDTSKNTIQNMQSIYDIYSSQESNKYSGYNLNNQFFPFLNIKMIIENFLGFILKLLRGEFRIINLVGT